MSKVVSPITAKVGVIGKLKESSYQPGQYYRSVLFIDLSKPLESEAAKIWKLLSDSECDGLVKGSTVQLVPAGTDKNGKEAFYAYMDKLHASGRAIVIDPTDPDSEAKAQAAIQEKLDHHSQVD